MYIKCQMLGNHDFFPFKSLHTITVNEIVTVIILQPETLLLSTLTLWLLLFIIMETVMAPVGAHPKPTTNGQTIKSHMLDSPDFRTVLCNNKFCYIFREYLWVFMFGVCTIYEMSVNYRKHWVNFPALHLCSPEAAAALSQQPSWFITAGL